MTMIRTFTGFPSEIEIQMSEYVHRGWMVAQLQMAVISTTPQKYMALVVFFKVGSIQDNAQAAPLSGICRLPTCGGKSCSNYSLCQIRQALDGVDDER